MKPQILAAVGFLGAVAIAYSFGLNASLAVGSPADLSSDGSSATGGLWLIVAFAALLCQTHIFSAPIRHWMRRRSEPSAQKYLKLEVIASSLGSGIAIAYVFLQLLPQLTRSHPDLRAINPYLILLGFLTFYGLERLALKIAVPNRTGAPDPVKPPARTPSLFGLEITFLCCYNSLIVYTMPELFRGGLASASAYMFAMLFHLLRGNHCLRDKYPKQFRSWGRNVLVATAIVSALASWFMPPPPELTEILMGILAVFILFHIFKDELPDRVRSSYRWLFTGALFLSCLICFSHS